MNTPFGRCKFLRLPIGIHSAQEVFHRIINGSYVDIIGVKTDTDVFFIWGKNTEDHNSLIASLERAKKNALTMNLDKCKFNVDELICLGCKISARGIEPGDTKIKVIMKPTDKKGIQKRFVCGKGFLPKLTEVTSLLRELLQKDIHWHWEEHHKKSFENVQTMLSSDPCLAYFDVSKPVTVQVDASNSSWGAALLQEGKSVIYASISLTSAEKNYAVIDKELLAVLFGCERFHQYVYGNKTFTESNHKPLGIITKKPLARATERLQRILLYLQKRDFKLSYKSGASGCAVKSFPERSRSRNIWWGISSSDSHDMQQQSTYWYKSRRNQKIERRWLCVIRTWWENSEWLAKQKRWREQWIEAALVIQRWIINHQWCYIQ